MTSGETVLPILQDYFSSILKYSQLFRKRAPLVLDNSGRLREMVVYRKTKENKLKLH